MECLAGCAFPPQPLGTKPTLPYTRLYVFVLYISQEPSRRSVCFWCGVQLPEMFVARWPTFLHRPWTTTIFIKIKALRGDPLNELADRWADMGRKVKASDGPTNRPIFSWTENGKPH